MPHAHAALPDLNRFDREASKRLIVTQYEQILSQDRQIEQLELKLARPVRRPLPDHLPRETRKLMPKQEVCPDCGGELRHLGETSIQLEG
jgi:uncharacterized protein with PIN domain